MNKIKQLFEENYAHVPLDDLDSAYIQTFASTIYNMMYKFGEECFNAGKKYGIDCAISVEWCEEVTEPNFED